MHGVGNTLAGLSDFVGCRFHAVDDLENIVYFRFVDAAERQLTIGVESGWVVRDASGAVVMSGKPRPDGVITAPPLGALVVAAETKPPNAVVLHLLSGHMICIIGNSDRYESFCIPHAGVYI
jgi:hypothetical protein